MPDRTAHEDRSQVRTRSSRQFLAIARNIAISLLRLAKYVNIARGLEHVSRAWTKFSLGRLTMTAWEGGDAYDPTLQMTPAR